MCGFFYPRWYKSLLERIFTSGERDQNYCQFYFIRSMWRMIMEDGTLHYNHLLPRPSTTSNKMSEGDCLNVAHSVHGRLFTKPQPIINGEKRRRDASLMLHNKTTFSAFRPSVEFFGLVSKVFSSSTNINGKFKFSNVARW